ncbi:MAG: UDP-N-acetylmuramate dehydrogenase [Pseudohongiella sp.]|nr:UDP-N-acetylmuramate dehydrogenase [Pseudohongiella sp.]MDP2127751.1 UDP-N-acetylmuramate dehydrogenase [Pseudohongiella sp.]
MTISRGSTEGTGLWQSDVDLRRLCSFATAARARFFVALEQEDELPATLDEANDKDLPVLIMGGGSNMLLTENYPGLVVKIDLKGISVRADSSSADHVLLNAAAGENWHALVEYCLDNSFYGIENLALIPGSVGAAPVQNIGAYGVELSDVLVSVRYFDLRFQQVVQLSAQECQLAYRDSIFKQALKGSAVILSVCLRLAKKPDLKIAYPALQQALHDISDPSARDVFNAVCAVRRSKLPDPAVLGNAGSFFRNPVVSRTLYQTLLQQWPELPSYATDNPEKVKLPAAWLIERAGWKGKRHGDAGVHEQQALVLVNYGQATGLQILQLAKAVARSVQQQFNISLEPEVNVLPASAWQSV